jgi:hypothetical protein
MKMGKLTCPVCKGNGKLKWFIRLKIEFQNIIGDYIKNSDCIPSELVKSCASENVFSEQNTRVFI